MSEDYEIIQSHFELENQFGPKYSQNFYYWKNILINVSKIIFNIDSHKT